MLMDVPLYILDPLTSSTQDLLLILHLDEVDDDGVHTAAVEALLSVHNH